MPGTHPRRRVALRHNLQAADWTRNRWADEIAVYVDVVDRFGDDPTPAIRKHVVVALRNMNVVLGEV
jgi:hypothetical protein